MRKRGVGSIGAVYDRRGPGVASIVFGNRVDGRSAYANADGENQTLRWLAAAVIEASINIEEKLT